MPALARVLIIHDPSNEIIIRDPLNLIINIESINNNSKLKMLGLLPYYQVSEELLGPLAILSRFRGTSRSVGHIIKFKRIELSPLLHAGYRNYYIALLTFERAIMCHTTKCRTNKTRTSQNINKIFVFLK